MFHVGVLLEDDGLIEVTNVSMSGCIDHFYVWDILYVRTDVDCCEKYICVHVILSMTCVSVVSHLMERCCVMLHSRPCVHACTNVEILESGAS